MPIFAVKAAYITAISRSIHPSTQPRSTRIPSNTLPSFVTGLLDSQQESKYKVSMYAKAQEIGLPALFVDLRHESTHGDIPSLSNLRSAAQRALEWLWDDYWCKLGGDTKLRAKGSMAGIGNDDSRLDMIECPDQLKDKVMEGSGRYDSNASDPIEELASWSKWQGHWVVRPIGSCDTY